MRSDHDHAYITVPQFGCHLLPTNFLKFNTSYFIYIYQFIRVHLRSYPLPILLYYLFSSINNPRIIVCVSKLFFTL